jgi:hypothetical protein
MNGTLFARGLAAIADAGDLDRLDAVRRTVAGHGSAGALTAAAVAILVDACGERAVELLDLERVEPAAAAAVAASSPAPMAPTAGVPDGDYSGTITQAMEREWPDSGLVLSVSCHVEIDGQTVEVKSRFDAGREIARKAMFRAAGLASGAAVEQLIGRPVRVEVGTWAPPGGGTPRPVVRRWLAAAGTAPAPSAPRPPAVVKGNTAKPPKQSRPEWEDDSIPF